MKYYIQRLIKKSHFRNRNITEFGNRKLIIVVTTLLIERKQAKTLTPFKLSVKSIMIKYTDLYTDKSAL